MTFFGQLFIYGKGSSKKAGRCWLWLENRQEERLLKG